MAEHALFAAIALLSVTFHDKLNELHFGEASQFFVLFLAALLLIEVIDWLIRAIAVRFKSLAGVGKIDGVWAQGFCNSNQSSPIGSYVEIRNAEKGFEIRGTAYTRQGSGEQIRKNDFFGRGFEIDGNRILYQFRGAEHAQEKPGIGYFDFTPADEAGLARYRGIFTDEITGEIRTVVGQRLREHTRLENQVLNWVRQNPACDREPLGDVGVVDGYWLEQIFDSTGNRLAGSAVKINRSIRGYSIEGWSCDEHGEDFGSFRGEGLECAGNRLVFYFDGFSPTGEKHGVGYHLFIRRSDMDAATEFAGYFLETDDKRLLTLKGRRVPQSMAQDFERNKQDLLLDWLHGRIRLA